LRDPIRQLREQPWAETFSCAGLALLGVIVLEAMLVFGVDPSTPIASFLAIPLVLLFKGALGYVVRMLMAVLVGVLAVLILERLFSAVRIQASVLWALVGSMMVLLLLRSLLESVVPPLFLSASFECLMALSIGIFWKGKPYW
jgi:hypothetical protein